MRDVHDELSLNPLPAAPAWEMPPGGLSPGQTLFGRRQASGS